MTAQIAKHWDEFYQSRPQNELGWYEADGQATLSFLEDVDLYQKRILITGVGSSNLIEDLMPFHPHLILNDISKYVLNEFEQKLKSSVPELDFKLCWGDLGDNDLEFPPCDIWIDRAVLHFLTGETQIGNYFQKLKMSVRKNGTVMLAQFTHETAPKCATLPIKHWDIETYQRHLGEDFQLIKEMNHVYINPRGEERLYIYGLFKRLNK